MHDDANHHTPGDRSSSRRSEPDACGQAALLLSESILHVLVESGALTLDQALDAVRTASETKAELAEQIGESGDRMRESLGLLFAIELSLTAAGRSAGRMG